MKNLKNNYMPLKQYVLGILISILPLLASSGESKIKRYYDLKEYDKIIEIINSTKSDKITGIRDYKICAQTAYMYGLYEESTKYYQKVISVNKNILTLPDMLNYAFCMVRQGKGDQILSDPVFKGKYESNTWLQHLLHIAKGNDSLYLKKDYLVNSKELTVDFLSQYGLDYFDNHIYYSFPRFSGKTKGNLPESVTINDRRSELAGIKKGRIGKDGKILTPEVIKKNLKKASRVATMNVTDKNENYFTTIVPRQGKPEQIIAHGNLYPPFPFNSTEYANAMPYFDKLCQRLYYCSTMPGGVGGWDIYYTELKNGQWTARVNLGPKVNTPFDELFPSVYKDMLIFSSEAQEGLGGFDNYIYSLTTGKLQNLWPFNTKGDDLSFRIIQYSPLKAVSVNVPNARYYLSGSDLETILNSSGTKPLEQPVIIEKIPEEPIAVVQAPTEVSESPKGVLETPVQVSEPIEPIKEKIEEPVLTNKEPKIIPEVTPPITEVPVEPADVKKEEITESAKIIEEPIAVVEPLQQIKEEPKEIAKEVVQREVPSEVPIVEKSAENIVEPAKIAEQPVVEVESSKKAVEVVIPVSEPVISVVETPVEIKQETKGEIVEQLPMAEVPVTVAEDQKVKVEEPVKIETVPTVEEDKPKMMIEEPTAKVVIPEKVAVDTIPKLLVPNSVLGETPKADESAILNAESGDLLLGNLYYDLNSAVFKSVHYAVLDSIVQKIKEKDCKNIVVWSYTDRVGAERYNGNLAFQRALGVVEYLKSKFTDASNKVYFTVAAGEYFANTTRETNAVDRRAEVYSSQKGLPFNVVYAYKPAKWETAESIAKTFNNDYERLKELNRNTPENRINSEIVYVGIQGIHVTSPGETIYRISQKYRCTIDQLLKANHKTNYDLSVAEKLIIPLPLSN